MSDELNFFSFLKKIEFMLGTQQNLQDINLTSIELYHMNEFHNLDKYKFIDKMYNIILQRMSDEKGKAEKIAELDSGKQRKDIVLEMIHSEEGQNHKDQYSFLGLNKAHFTFISEQLLYQTSYNEIEFNLLIDFFNSKHQKISENNILFLLQYSGLEFIFLSYKIIYKRTPNLEEFNKNLQGIYSFEDKITKIYNFSHTKEAKEKKNILRNVNGKPLLSYSSSNDITLENLSEEVYHILQYHYNITLKLSNYTFRNIFLFKDLEVMILLSKLTLDPFRVFQYIIIEIYKNKKNLVELFYDSFITKLLKKEYVILDFYNQNISQNSSNTHLLRNLQAHISFKESLNIAYINEYNIKLNHKDNEISVLINYMKQLVSKKHIDTILQRDEQLLERVDTLEEILKEHEELFSTIK